MAPEPTREKVAPPHSGSTPRKVGMYDRPATANRQPMLIIIAVLAVVAVLISLYFFNFF